jgi:D-amino-acid dehydrogenase
MSKIGVIGGGIVGLSSAYYLNKTGHQVTIMDQSDLKDGCSFGNAGMIVPSHIIPLAAPGMISKGIRWMFNSRSPFYVKPRLNGDLIKWGYHFYRSSTKEHVAKSAPALKNLSFFSKEMYQQLAKDLPFNFGYHERGLLMLYKSKEAEHEETEMAKFANQQGVEAQILSSNEIQKMEPDVRVDVLGGIYFPGDAHLTPGKLVPLLINYLKEQGVKFQLNTSVSDFVLEKEKIKTIKTNTGDLIFDEVVLASGSWSGLVGARLGLSLPMQAGKGYSFTLADIEKNIQIPSIFLEARVAVTPMGNSLRFGGTMEITGIDHGISMNRVKGIVDSIPKYYPDMNVVVPDVKDVWHGLRPCSPDGLPYIGRSSQIKNLTIAAGHSMMGLSQGPGTGKLVSEILNQEKVSIGLTAFSPERFD